MKSPTIIAVTLLPITLILSLVDPLDDVLMVKSSII